MGNSPDIKIVISCHKESVVPDNPLLIPVQVGAALSARRLPIRGDDEGVITATKKYDI